jgi:plasmid stabilization system protein ParE
MSQYALTSRARRDLDEIWDFIAEDSVDAADRWIEKLLAEIDLLAGNPGIGHKRTDLTHLPVFFWSVDAYLILYRVANAQVEIVAVTQGSRDVPRLLGNRE